MRNWLKAFRPASFRGVPFYVDVEGASGARRLSISPIAYADQAVIEDMGRDPRQMSTRAYVVGDVADVAAIAFIEALERKGPGLLVLPMQGQISARVLDWSMDREKDRAGYVGFDITFIEEGQGAVAFQSGPSIGHFGDLLSLGSALLSSAVTGSASNRQAEADAIAAAVSRVNQLAALLSPGGDPVREWQDAMGVLAGVAPTDLPGFAAASVSAWRAVALYCEAEDAARQVGGSIEVARNTVAGLVEAAAMLGAIALMTARDEYPARQDAAAARAFLSATASPILAEVGALGAPVLDWLSGLTGEVALALSRGDADRAPLVRAETGFSLSAIRAAFELYGDANRAGELISRNRVATATYMPVAFEALAR
ncbi:DNA circularization N-terminal domain-containing protein [Mesorhizobium sp. KR2-14]|uniref:DNA circularization N-terminal domain-containing protein n=1 Tax=Mesorhizobium sp. KR2-14 TaxID=3156610 RepID=UPI0032B4112C